MEVLIQFNSVTHLRGPLETLGVSATVAALSGFLTAFWVEKCLHLHEVASYGGGYKPGLVSENYSCIPLTVLSLYKNWFENSDRLLVGPLELRMWILYAQGFLSITPVVIFRPEPMVPVLDGYFLVS
jgi:hypothetical protein